MISLTGEVIDRQVLVWPEEVAQTISPGVTNPINKRLQVVHVASQAAQDDEAGLVIAEAVGLAGEDGVITVEENTNPEYNVAYREGLQIDQGFIAILSNINPGSPHVAVEEATILITDKLLYGPDQFPKYVPRSLVILAPAIEGSALATLLRYKRSSPVDCIAVKPVAHTAEYHDILGDLAIFASGTSMDSASSSTIVGRADRVVSTPFKTIFFGGGGSNFAIQARLIQIKMQIKNATSRQLRDHLQYRLANLSGLVTVIYVGGDTYQERANRKARIDRGLEAVKDLLESELP